jgi:protease I
LRALIVSAPGVQDVEFIYPYYRFREAGFHVEVAAPSLDPFRGIGGLEFKPTFEIYRIGKVMEDVLVLPGGVKAMEKLRQDEHLVDYIRDCHAAGKVIASMCSGAQLLISAGLVKGRTISAYPAMRVDVENAGAQWHPGPVVECDRIVSSPHYDHLGPWMAAVLNAVHSNELREGAACAAAL